MLNKINTNNMVFILIFFSYLASIWLLSNDIALENNNYQDEFLNQLVNISGNYWKLEFDFWAIENSHVIRWLIFLPFIENQPEARIFSDYAIYLLYCTPLMLTSAFYRFWFIPLLIVILPYGMSYRSAFVAVGMAYFIFGLVINKNNTYIVLGFIFSILSTASMLQSLMLYIALEKRSSATFLKTAFFIGTCYAFYISTIDKISGALSGGIGYVSNTENQNILMNYLSRNTLYNSFVNNEPRFYFYLLLTLLGASLLIWTILKSGKVIKIQRKILISASPGFLFEGLGVLSMLIVFPMLISPTFKKIIEKSEGTSQSN